MLRFDSECVVEGRRTIQAERKSLFPNCFGWSSSSLSLVSNYLHEQQIFLHFVIPIHHILYCCKLFLVKKKCACIECTLAVYFEFKKYI